VLTMPIGRGRTRAPRYSDAPYSGFEVHMPLELRRMAVGIFHLLAEVDPIAERYFGKYSRTFAAT
jgi:hypothetical protein